MSIFKKEQLNKEKIEVKTEQSEPLLEAQKNIEKPQKERVPLTYKYTADDDTEQQKQADKLRKIKFEGRKVEHLLNIAKEKGAGYAVSVAKKANDACLLDLLHDKLIEENIK